MHRYASVVVIAPCLQHYIKFDLLHMLIGLPGGCSKLIAMLASWMFYVPGFSSIRGSMLAVDHKDIGDKHDTISRLETP